MSDPASANRTRIFLLAGLGAVALAAAVIFLVLPLLTGDEAPDDGTDVVVVDGETPTPAPTEDFELADPEDVEGQPPAETFEVFNARDPFQQLVDDSAGGDGAADGTTGDGAAPPAIPPTDPGTGTPPGTGTTPPPGDTSPPPDTSNGGTGTNGTGTDGTNGTDGNGGNGSEAQVGGTQVTLVDVFTEDDGERQATVTVNGTGYTVGEGETFARRFRLLDISGRCATMLFGDSRFTLCEGERIRK